MAEKAAILAAYALPLLPQHEMRAQVAFGRLPHGERSELVRRHCWRALEGALLLLATERRGRAKLLRLHQGLVIDRAAPGVGTQ